MKTPPPAVDAAAYGNASTHDSQAPMAGRTAAAPNPGQGNESGPVSGDSVKAESPQGTGEDNASGQNAGAGTTSASDRRGEETVDSSGTAGETAAPGGRDEAEPASNGKENQVVHTRSVSIKGVLKGKPRTVPVADEEITENDQVDKAVPAPPEKMEVTEEMIQNAWKAYAASIEKSHPRIYTTLSQQVPRLTEKGIIRISLATEAQRENFIHRIKPDLTRYFQKTIAEVTYVFETDLLDNETTVKKVYTDQDKLDYLINKNPDLDKLKSRFNLDFDN